MCLGGGDGGGGRFAALPGKEISQRPPAEWCVNIRNDAFLSFFLSFSDTMHNEATFSLILY